MQRRGYLPAPNKQRGRIQLADRMEHSREQRKLIPYYTTCGTRGGDRARDQSRRRRATTHTNTHDEQQRDREHQRIRTASKQSRRSEANRYLFWEKCNYGASTQGTRISPKPAAPLKSYLLYGPQGKQKFGRRTAAQHIAEATQRQTSCETFTTSEKLKWLARKA